jgi:hypothetical protein
MRAGGREIEADRDCSGVWKFKTLDGRRLIKWIAVVTASDQCFVGTCAPRRRARAVSRICHFFLSAIPFCCGVWGHEVS